MKKGRRPLYAINCDFQKLLSCLSFAKVSAGKCFESAASPEADLFDCDPYDFMIQIM